MKRQTRDSAYQLRVAADGETAFLLELLELGPGETADERLRESRRVSTCRGLRLRVAFGAVTRSLVASGHDGSELRRGRRLPFLLPEAEGIRLDVLFRSLSRVSKRTGMERVVNGIVHMNREEAYYWHAKTSRNNGTRAEDGLAALRTLLAGET